MNLPNRPRLDGSADGHLSFQLEICSKASSSALVTTGRSWRSTSMNSTPSRPISWSRAGALPALLLAAGVVALVGCGGTIATATPSGAAPIAATSSSTSATSSSTAAASSSTPVPAALNPTAVPTPTVDVAAAEQAALALFVKLPLNPSDPSTGYVWMSGPASASHMTAAVNARLVNLKSRGYFSDGGGCGEDYITATQNGLFTAPTVSSALADASGGVTVIIKRGAQGADLTLAMTNESGTWLASDLASGTGPAASIFSAKPNC
jgi:hypothetical protein